MKYICVRCGKEFEAKRKTAVCTDCHTAVCVICGKEFKLQTPWTQQTCSSKCRGIYRKESGVSKIAAAKAQKTVEDKYGVSNIKELQKFKRNCKYCGKEFETTNANQFYCGDVHYGDCPVCGELTVIKDLVIGPQACSERCRQERIRRTNQEKYNVDNVFESDEVKKKSKQTLLDKYGVEHYSQTKEFKELMSRIQLQKYKESVDQRIQTNVEKYGVPYPMMNEEIKAKSKATVQSNYGGFGWASEKLSSIIKATNLERYSVENPAQSDSIKQKIKNTMIDKYGENPYQHSDILTAKRRTSQLKYGVDHPSKSKLVKNKIKTTSREKFGVDNPFQSEQIKSKIKTTNLEKYGVENPMQSVEIQEKAKVTNLLKYGNVYYKGSVKDLQHSLTDPSKLDEFIEFKNDPRSYIEHHFSSKPTLTEVTSKIGCNSATTSFYILKHECTDLIDYHISNAELEVIQFLSSYVDRSKIILHDKTLIKPKELDIYLPEYNLAIEVNPTYTHNSSKSSHFDGLIVPYNYHQQKTIECEAKNIRLIHIFGYQWTLKQDIVKSMIVNVLNRTPKVYYARKLVIKKVSDKESRQFLDKNHIQGYTTSKVRLGLFEEENLICLMTFSRKRSTIGLTSKDSKDDWELSRFCTLKYCRCVGGASKLFKYFINEYEPSSVVSFSDRSNTSGGIYSKLGFSFDSYVSPGYVWVDAKTDYYYNRVSCQKRNLRKLFNDTSIDIENKTETEIMEEHGFVKVYNSGLIKWVYKQGD